MISETDIRKALDIDLPLTARGRAKMDGKEIDLEPDKQDVLYHRKERAMLYKRASENLASEVRNLRKGITNDELESVEFIREQLRALTKKVLEQYGDLL
jgi:uncharacterized linocin/CFP29 family protein